MAIIENGNRKQDNNLPKLIDCQLICSSSAEPLSQIFTGFGLLGQQKVINLSIKRAKTFYPGLLAKPMLSAFVNGDVRVTYDVFNSEAIDLESLEWCDYYFKRSLNPRYLKTVRGGYKVYPLGLNYPVYGDEDFSFQRILWSFQASRNLKHLRKSFVMLARSWRLAARLLRTNGGRFTSSIASFEAEPIRNDNPRVFFVARLWDPKRVKNDWLAEERHAMNSLRLECVRMLRLAFGDRFTGGLEPTDYARRHFPQDVIEDVHSIKKQNYLRTMKSTDICVSTAGLLRSVPWKLGEYVAASRAIVSETIHFTIPGNFHSGQNYLEFSSADECLDQVSELMEDSELRYRMMQANQEYYRQYLRPDRLIWNTLQRAVKSGEGNGSLEIESR